MGVIKTSKDQYLLVTDSSKVQEKGKSKKKEPKTTYSEPKQNEKILGSYGSKKKNKMCPYCMRGFHPEDSCMKKTLDQMKALCVQNNICLPQRAVMSNDEEQTEEDEICLHASLSLSKAYVIDSGASNYMVASMESFITLPLSGGPSSHIGYAYKILDVERCSDKIYHDEFMPSPTKKQIVEDEEEADFSLQSI